MEKVTCHVVGVAQGNPGPAAVGVRVVDASGDTVLEKAHAIGNASASFAQYNAVMVALQLLSGHFGAVTRDTHFTIHLDDEEVKTQLNSEGPVTHPGLVPMFIEIHNLRVASFPHLAFVLVTESENKITRELVMRVLVAHHLELTI